MSKPASKLTARSIALASVAIFLSSGAYLGLHEFAPAKAQTPVSIEQQVIPVGVHTVVPRKVRVWSEFSGRLSAVDYAEIRPEVSGRITEVRFRDGETVKAGEILYVIDPRPFEAAVAKAEANLASARTNADYAQVELDRATTLIRSQAIAQRIYDQTANAKRVADAAVLAADAELKQARIDIDHAYVKAPITGRMSRPEITVGNLVQAGPNAPLLTSIVSNDGIYADFDVDEQTYLESVRSSADTDAKEKKIPVELTVSGQKDHRRQQDQHILGDDPGACEVRQQGRQAGARNVYRRENRRRRRGRGRDRAGGRDRHRPDEKICPAGECRKQRRVSRSDVGARSHRRAGRAHRSSLRRTRHRQRNAASAAWRKGRTHGSCVQSVADSTRLPSLPTAKARR